LSKRRDSGFRLVVSLLVLSAFSHASGQSSIRVVPGWGVDTSSTWSGDYTSQGPVPDIYHAWSEYLRTAAKTQSPTPLWSASEQANARYYDQAASIGVYQGFPGTVLSIQPSAPGRSSEYVVRTLFANANGPNKDVKPLALTRVYAITENGRWVFSNALPRLTAEWKRYTTGPIHYFIQPSRAFDLRKANSAARFADSLATMFGVPRLNRIDYYLADTPEEIDRIRGLDFYVGGAQASYADVARHAVYVGNAAFGEDHRHEIAHVVLYPLIVAGKTPGIVNEGLVTWVGGSLGKPFEGVIAEYAAFLSAHPTITLDSVLTVPDHDYGTRPAGAALVALAYRAGGIAAIKTLMAGGQSDDDLRASAVKVFGKPWPDIDELWHIAIMSFPGPELPLPPVPRSSH
jgi:hypothetical protein